MSTLQSNALEKMSLLPLVLQLPLLEVNIRNNANFQLIDKLLYYGPVQ
jgi:hypothetical protein